MFDNPTNRSDIARTDPISCDSIMKELSDLVSNSKKSRIESQLFLEQAKRYVEKLIEQEVQK